jgi:hypothetical protein
VINGGQCFESGCENLRRELSFAPVIDSKAFWAEVFSMWDAKAEAITNHTSIYSVKRPVAAKQHRAIVIL